MATAPYRVAPSAPPSDGIVVLGGDQPVIVDAAPWSPPPFAVGPLGRGAFDAGATGTGPFGPAPSPPPALPLRAAALVLGGFAAQLTLSGFVLRHAPPSIAAVVALASMVVQYVTMGALCLYALRHWGGRPLREQLSIRPGAAEQRLAATAFLGGLGAIALAAAVLRHLGVPLASNNPLTGGDGGGVTLSTGLAIAVLGVVMLVAAPVFEELLFRGVVLRALSARMPSAVAVPAQAVVFGLFHIEPARGAGNIGLVVVLSVLGVGLGLVAARSGKGLGGSMLAHALHNAVAFAIGVAALT